MSCSYDHVFINTVNDDVYYYSYDNITFHPLLPFHVLTETITLVDKAVPMFANTVINNGDLFHGYSAAVSNGLGGYAVNPNNFIGDPSSWSYPTVFWTSLGDFYELTPTTFEFNFTRVISASSPYVNPLYEFHNTLIKDFVYQSMRFSLPRSPTCELDINPIWRLLNGS